MAASRPGIPRGVVVGCHGDAVTTNTVVRRCQEQTPLVYLDPPFNSKRNYNVIFRDESGNKSDAQLIAFEDTWHWGPDAERQYAFLTNSAQHQGRVPQTVTTIIAALRSGLGENQMTAYLVEMAVRLVELRRVLKPSGSLYLHCDPTASHYLKVVLDAIFGPRNFVNEIIWHYNTGGATQRRFSRKHDTLLLYAKDDRLRAFNSVHEPYREEKTPHFTNVDAEGRHYRIRSIGGKDYIYYLDDGRIAHDVWAVDALNAYAKDRLGWDTQKPVPLLERIISASSNPGDIVLDPFCGCGTALVAAQKLGRRWIGIDITYLAIRVMRHQLEGMFPELAPVQVEGRPTEVEGARELLAKGGLAGQYQFQWWALDLVGAMPKGGGQKKGADRGVDGVITFTGPGGKLETVIVSVKSGGVNRGMIDELKGAMASHGAAMGLFVTLEPPSGPMRRDAATAGFYHSDVSGRDYPILQIITIRELLEEGRKPELPLLVLPTFQPAERAQPRAPEQAELFGN